MRNNIILIVLMVFFGCTPKEIIKIKPVTIVPPVIEDSIKATIITDTVIIANTIYKKDTVTIVKYFPKEKKFYIKVKPDTITIMDTVRTEIVKEKVEEKYNSWVMYAYIVGAIMFMIMTYKLFK